MSEQNFTNKNLKDIKPEQWTLVQYEGEHFLGIVLLFPQKVQKHPYGVSGPQDTEKETRVWYPSEMLFKAPVVPNVVQIKRAWKYTY